MKISVIIPCFNVEKWIERCLKSIINQTIGVENYEIICVDDCSQDGTIEILYKWEKEYPQQFIIVNSSKNCRQGQARNIGIEYASGDWIAFIDADDWVEPDYLKVLYEQTLRFSYDVVCCKDIRDASKDLVFLDNTGTGKINDIYIKDDNVRKQQIIKPSITYSAWGKLIKKSFLIDNNLFFPANLTYEDAAWGSLMVLYLSSACIIENTLYHYFVNNESTVLSRNTEHHLDCLTVQTWLWREYKERGFLDKYYYELQIEHIYSAYLAGLKAMIFRYEEPNYNGYLLLRELVMDRICDYGDNPYIKSGILSELYMIMMQSLNNQLAKNEFEEFAKSIQTIGI